MNPTTPSRHRTASRRGVAIAAAWCVALGASVTAAAPAASEDVVDPPASTTTTLPFTTATDLVVDPVTGRSFVSGDDQVEVFDAAGGHVASLPEHPDAGGLAVDDGSLFVLHATTDEVVRLDPATLAETGSWPLGADATGPLDASDGVVRFLVGGGAIGSLDPATGTSATSQSGTYLDLASIPGQPDLVLAWGPPNNRKVHLLDVTGTDATIVASVPTDLLPQRSDATVSADGRLAWIIGGQEVVELSLPDLKPTGMHVDLPGLRWAGAMAAAEVDGVAIVAATGASVPWEPGLHIMEAGIPSRSHSLVTSVDIPFVAFAADGRSVHTIRSSSTTSFRTESLAPDLSGLEGFVPRAAERTSFVATGTGIGDVRSVSVGGVAVPARSLAPDRVRIDLPGGLADGPVEVVTLFGRDDADLLAGATTGDLSGFATDHGAPVPGLELTLTGGPLAAPRTTATDDRGRYWFEDLPWGDDYALAVHDPSATYADETVGAIEVQPGHRTDQALALGDGVPTDGDGWRDGLVTLDGPAQDVVVDPGTGRAFVSSGNSVTAVEPDGTLAATIGEVWTAADLAVGDGSVWVNERNAGRIARIDPATLAVTERFSTEGFTTGALAWARGELFTTAGRHDATWLQWIDPDDGTVSGPAPIGTPVDRLGPIAGQPNGLVGWRRGGDTVLTVDTVLPGSEVHVAASGVDDAAATTTRVWTDEGAQHRRLAGVDDPSYPSTGDAVAFSDDIDGDVAVFGRRVVRPASPPSAITSHDLGAQPAPGALAIRGGNQVVVGDGDGQVTTWDLRPRPTEIAPDGIRPGLATSVTVTGTGLSQVTEATVGGVPVPVTQVSRSEIRLDVPAMPSSPSPRPVSLTTRFGTTADAGTVLVRDRAPAPLRSVQGTTIAPYGVEVTWEPSVDPGSHPVIAYEVEVAGLRQTIPAEAERVARFPGVPSGRPAPRVRAVSSVGPSLWFTVGFEGTPFVPQPEDLFPDVLADHPFHLEIWTAVDQGIATGDAEGLFRPIEIVTRQAAVAFLWRAAGSPTGFPDPGFADVAATNPFRPAIAWAVATGVTTGYADGSFRPTDPVSRQSWLAFQHRAAGAPTGPFPDPGFSDVPATHPFALPIAWAVDQAITTGYVDGTFRPTDPVTRQAAVAFLVRPTWPTWEPTDPG